LPRRLWTGAIALDGNAAASESSQIAGQYPMVRVGLSREEFLMATAAAAKELPTPPRIAKDHLKAFVERIERLGEERKAISDDIRDVYAEAKANGFDVKALRTIVRLRRLDIAERKEQEAILETYLHALGMLDS
jgi:uncharacterized protein (UPF0335 family)